MKYIVVLLLVALLLIGGCDTNLVEDHDHDGDGVQDHAADEHDEELVAVETDDPVEGNI